MTNQAPSLAAPPLSIGSDTRGVPAGGTARKWVARLGLAAGLIAIIGAIFALRPPRFLPYRTYTVLTGSMRPTIPTGSLIVLRPIDGSRIRVGDIITFNRPDGVEGVVTHRVVEIVQGSTGRSFVTRGDANSEPDAWRVPAEGKGWRYAATVPFAGKLLAIARSPLGHLLSVVAPAGGLALFFLLTIWRQPQG